MVLKKIQERQNGRIYSFLVESIYSDEYINKMLDTSIDAGLSEIEISNYNSNGEEYLKYLISHGIISDFE